MYPIEYFRALNCISPKKEIRHYLNGVYVDGNRLVASCGPTLAVIHSPNADRPEMPGFIVPCDVVEQICKMRGNWLVEFERVSETQIKATVSGSILTFSPVDGKFPDYRSVLSGAVKANGEAAHYNPDLVQKFVKAAKALGLKPTNIVITQGGTGSARVQFIDREEFFGVLMPCRHLTMTVPTWVSA